VYRIRNKNKSYKSTYTASVTKSINKKLILIPIICVSSQREEKLEEALDGGMLSSLN